MISCYLNDTFETISTYISAFLFNTDQTLKQRFWYKYLYLKLSDIAEVNILSIYNSSYPKYSKSNNSLEESQTTVLRSGLPLSSPGVNF